MMNGKIAFIVFAISLVTLGMSLGLVSYPLIYEKVNDKLNQFDQNNGCNNLSLFKTSDCLKQEVDGFYQYNITNIGKKLDLPTLKEIGGVCSHYSEYFYDRFKELGFNSELVSFQINGSEYHQVTISSDNSGYCINDQIVNECWSFEE